MSAASKQAERWQCETCGTVYAEYVNGCPRCWDAGIRSGVRCRLAVIQWGECDSCLDITTVTLTSCGDHFHYFCPRCAGEEP